MKTILIPILMKNFKHIFAASFWVLLLAIVSCNRDDISFESPTQALRFSADTVFLDTVYNQVRSETYAVKLYNDENKDILIPNISLETGASSLYRINVDGKAGTTFNNVPLRKKDSLYIFVEIAPVANAPEAIAEDRIKIQSSAGDQHITLFSVVQDAEFYIESATNPNILTSNTTWTNDKAKIIFGDLKVEEGKTLEIEKGTKVYFFKNSGLRISKNAHLKINGDLGEEVIFRGDRNDPRYDTIPKNWNGIVMDPTSTLDMNYAKVLGGTRGLEISDATANISNSIFHTHQEFGIMAINSVVTAKNLVINNCGEADFAIFKGGNYDLTHCTLANYWDLNSAMPGLGLSATNEYDNGSSVTQGPLSLTIKNSIIYGDKEDAMEFKPTSGQVFNYSIQSSLVKYGNNSNYTIDGNSIKNKDPHFQNYFTAKMNLRLMDDSPAKGKGNPTIAATVPLDIVKVSRTSNPSMGAYQ